MVVVKGLLVVQDKERNTICKIDTNVNARCCYKILKENEVLDDEVDYIEVIKDTMYITIK